METQRKAVATIKQVNTVKLLLTDKQERSSEVRSSPVENLAHQSENPPERSRIENAIEGAPCSKSTRGSISHVQSPKCTQVTEAVVEGARLL